ncbi:hypothetical protein M406DRAFT_224055, partial [Cryphonectria parasitica EP155]
LSRVEKSFSKKTEQHNHLFLAINQFGFEIISCTACAFQGLVCKIMDDAKRCSQYIRCTRSCNSFSRIIAEDKRLESKEREAEAELEGAHFLDEACTKISESAACLACLRTQRRSLASRGAQMVNAGLESLDELDERERRE